MISTYAMYTSYAADMSKSLKRVATEPNVENDTQKEFSASVQGSGRSLQIDDQFKDTSKTLYKYTISVSLDGTGYTSPDPHIVNDPGGGGG